MTGQQPGYSSKLIYISPTNFDGSIKEKVGFIAEEDGVIKLRSKSGQEKLQSEWGSSQKARFVLSGENDEIRCLDCEAMSHLFDLESLDLSKPDTDLVQAMSKMQKTLLWILENSNWGSA